MHDTLAYLRYYGFKQDIWIDELMSKSTYKKVFLLEPLKVFEKDYARTEDEKFSKSIQKLLYNAYADFGMKPILVPPVSVEKRVKLILKHIEGDAVNLTT